MINTEVQKLIDSGKIKITNDGNIIMQFSNYHHVIDSDTELCYKHQVDKVIADLKERHEKEINKQTECWNRLCAKYNKLIQLKKDFCEKFKDIELEIDI